MSAFEQLRHTDTGEPIAPDQAFAARKADRARTNRASVACTVRPSSSATAGTLRSST